LCGPSKIGKDVYESNTSPFLALSVIIHQNAYI
jgi:hypothetical protein